MVRAAGGCEPCVLLLMISSSLKVVPIKINYIYFLKHASACYVEI